MLLAPLLDQLCAGARSVQSTWEQEEQTSFHIHRKTI
jgi:hypothetical protein